MFRITAINEILENTLEKFKIQNIPSHSIPILFAFPFWTIDFLSCQKEVSFAFPWGNKDPGRDGKRHDLKIINTKKLLRLTSSPSRFRTEDLCRPWSILSWSIINNRPCYITINYSIYILFYLPQFFCAICRARKRESTKQHLFISELQSVAITSVRLHVYR